jgi:hypothetical protein
MIGGSKGRRRRSAKGQDSGAICETVNVNVKMESALSLIEYR